MTQNDENIKAIKDIRNKLDAVINKEELTASEAESKYPNAVNHFRISMTKSVIRIGAGLALVSGELLIAGSLLILAEILGIAEELV